MNLHIPTIPIPFLGKKAKLTAARRKIGWVFLAVSILAGSTSPSFAKQLTTSFSPLSLLFVSEILLITFSMLSFGLVPIIRKITEL